MQALPGLGRAGAQMTLDCGEGGPGNRLRKTLHREKSSPCKSEAETGQKSRVLNQSGVAHHTERSCPTDLGLGGKNCPENRDS